MLRVEPEIKANYVAAGQVALAFHHVLDHGAASHLAHRAAECAGAQNPLAFWQLHDMLFERQGELWNATMETVALLANEIGLDETVFRACMDDPAIAAKIERMDQQRRSAGIRLRPSFDLNGNIISGGIPYQQFAALLDDVLPQ